MIEAEVAPTDPKEPDTQEKLLIVPIRGKESVRPVSPSAIVRGRFSRQGRADYGDTGPPTVRSLARRIPLDGKAKLGLTSALLSFANALQPAPEAALVFPNSRHSSQRRQPQ